MGEEITNFFVVYLQLNLKKIHISNKTDTKHNLVSSGSQRILAHVINMFEINCYFMVVRTIKYTFAWSF